MARVNQISEKSFMAECDAHTLAEAKAIMANKERMAAAKKAASKMMPNMEKNAAEARAKLTAMKNLSQNTKKRK